QMGGVAAAIEAYRSSPTPNVIVLESEGRGDAILTGLDALAEFCDAGTRVIVIGRTNDVVLYRELVRRGVSDYMISPVGTIDVVRSICSLFTSPDAKPVGRIIAVVGAKGGGGASTVAHHVDWGSARDPPHRRPRRRRAVGGRSAPCLCRPRSRPAVRPRRSSLQSGPAARHCRR